MPFQWEDLTNCSTKTILLWLVSSQVPEPALLTVSQVGALLFSASSWFQLYRKYWHKSCTCVTWRRSVMSASHGIKGKTSDQAFRAVSYNLYKRKQTKMHVKPFSSQHYCFGSPLTFSKCCFQPQQAEAFWEKSLNEKPTVHYRLSTKLKYRMKDNVAPHLLDVNLKKLIKCKCCVVSVKRLQFSTLLWATYRLFSWTSSENVFRITWKTLLFTHGNFNQLTFFPCHIMS